LSFLAVAFLSLVSGSSGASSIVVADFLGQTDILGGIVFSSGTALLASGLESTDPLVAARLRSRGSGVTFLVGSIDLAVTADEVAFGGVRVLCFVLFVSSSSQASEDGGEKGVLEPREVDDNSRGTGSHVASSGVVGVADQTEDFVVSSDLSSIISSDESTSDIEFADTFESSVGFGDVLGLDAEVLVGVEEASDASGSQVSFAFVTLLQEHLGEFQDGEGSDVRGLVSIGNGVEALRGDG